MATYDKRRRLEAEARLSSAIRRGDEGGERCEMRTIRSVGSRIATCKLPAESENAAPIVRVMR